MEYAGVPVVFLEDNVDVPLSGRLDYWFAASGGGGAYLPLTMVDSGHAIMDGYDPLNQHDDYKSMVDASLARVPQASFDQLTSARAGNHIHFSGRVTNLLPTTLPATARVHILVYEQHIPAPGEHTTTRIIRTGISQETGVSLATGASTTFALNTADLTNVADWSKVHAIVLIDYQPTGSGAYDMLQAAVIYPIVKMFVPFLKK